MSNVVRHEPPLTDALASRPGGRLIVKTSGVSVLSSDVGGNFRSIPRFCVAAALVPAL